MKVNDIRTSIEQINAVSTSVVFSSTFSQSSFLYIMSFLESFLLTAMSSQLSKLLVVYTEVMQLQRMGSIKQTVILIITGKLPHALFFVYAILHTYTVISLVVLSRNVGLDILFNMFVCLTCIPNKGEFLLKFYLSNMVNYSHPNFSKKTYFKKLLDVFYFFTH